MDQTNVFIISAPSGSGKSTLVQYLLSTVPGLVFSISYTTRQPRGKEQNGKHYYFITCDEFEHMIERNELLEHAVLFGKDMYGTARRFLDDARERGCDLVLDIDVQGAGQLKRKLPDAVSIFILPPSREVLEQRLRRRGEDPEDVIERRLRRAVAEIENYSKYDYVIINRDKEIAAEELCAVVQAARWERRRDRPQTDPQVGRWLELAERCRTGRAEAAVSDIRRTFLEVKQSGSY